MSIMRVLSFDVGIRHLAYADITYNDENGVMNYRINRWGVLDVTDGEGLKKNKKGSFDVLSCQILAALDTNFNDPDIVLDVVLIENQPANKNPLMKSVQMIIYTYFTCLTMFVGTVGAVKLVSASRKTTCMVFAPPSPPAAAVALPVVPRKDSRTRNTHEKDDTSSTRQSDSAKYRVRKAESIRIAAHYLDHVVCDASAAGTLRTSKKKDDLCDCLLQALWFIETTCHITAASTTSQAITVPPP